MAQSGTAIVRLSDALAPEARLRRSLRLLERALAEQATAVHAFKEANVELMNLAKQIESSLVDYQRELFDIEQVNGRLARHAKDLRDWCDRYDLISMRP